MMEERVLPAAAEGASDNLEEPAPAAEEPSEPTYTPEKLIPFRITRKEALASCRKYYEGRWLLPKIFCSAEHMEELQGGYVPYLLHSGAASGNVEYDAQDSTPQDGPGKIVKKLDNFTVTREGTIRFERIPVIAPGLIPGSFMPRLEPCDFDALRPIAESREAEALEDYSAMEIADDRPEMERRVTELVSRLFRETVKHDFVQETKGEVRILEDDVECVLLPIYILTTRFGRKNYHFAVNGQTGAVYGDLPVHQWKLLAAFSGYFFGSAAATTAVFQVILRLLGKG